jgi:LysM repeat protein
VRWRLVLVVSLGLNIALGAVFWSIVRHAAPAGEVTGLQAATTNKAKTPAVVVRKQFFSWREVESADYPAYIANLKGIGCPEQTVRDIIVADVNQLYAGKRQDAIDTPEEQWWRTPPDTNFIAAAQGKLNALEQERRGLLTALLGTNWDSTIPATTRQIVALNGPVLGDLSPEAKDAVQKILARSQERAKAYLDGAEKAGTKPDPTELVRLEKQTRAELAQVLNPAQMEEFLLRYSQTAINLRNRFKGFEATPDEFRAIFQALDPIELEMAGITGDAATVASERAAFQKQEDDVIKNALGERYQSYLQAEDPAYQAALAAGKEAGATPDMVQKLYALNKLIAQQRAQIQNDPTLTDDQKAAQLAALDQQQQTLGDQILGVPPPPPVPPIPQPPQIQAVHSFTPGETIEMIASQYGVTVSAIVNANPSMNLNVLQRGAQINIPNPPQSQ